MLSESGFSELVVPEMTVDENRMVEKENSDNFPVGMRVLAVDDDPICLKLLECLLRKCQYHGMFIAGLVKIWHKNLITEVFLFS